MYQFSLDWFQQDMFTSCITNQNMVAMKEIESKPSPHLTGTIRPESRQSVGRVSIDNKASMELLGKLKDSVKGSTVNTDDPAELKNR